MGGSKFYGVNIYGHQSLLGGVRNMKCSRSDFRLGLF